MNILHKYPPNFEKIVAVFPSARRAGVIFTYGNTIYAPGLKTVHPALVAHEQVHCKRQGREVEEWWDKYLRDAEFRFNEELLAHRAEYRYFQDMGRNERRAQLGAISKRLASPLYGSMLNAKQARKAITKAKRW